MEILPIIIQGGAVGLCAFVIYVLWKVLTNDLTHIGKYINSNTKVLTELKDAIGQLKETLNKKL